MNAIQDQTIQVAWNGGVTPYISGDVESDLFQYYTGYSDSSGVLVPHAPISIADINDNDNFHQLCFPTTDEIVKISMLANTVEDPNHDPNLYSEIDVSTCTPSTIVEDDLFEEGYQIYQNPFTDEIFVENLRGDECFIVHDFLRNVLEGKCLGPVQMPATNSGMYFLTILNKTNQTTFKLVKMSSAYLWTQRTEAEHPQPGFGQVGFTIPAVYAIATNSGLFSTIGAIVASISSFNTDFFSLGQALTSQWTWTVF